MLIGIAGAGAIAMGYAAFLLDRGHAANIWSPTGARTAALAESKSIKVTGALEGNYNPGICNKAKDLVQSDVIVLALPAYGHRDVMDSLLPYIERRHTVIISGHLSFAALYLAKKLAERGIRIPIVAWSTTVLTCKAQALAEIRIGTIRAKVDMAVLPVSCSAQAHSLCAELFGDRFVIKDDILTIALSNLNPQNHMGIALCNLTRIENGESWGQNSYITPAVGSLLESLDRERLDIAAAFGKSVRTIFDHFTMSFGVTDETVAGIARKLSAQGNDPMGPKDIATRYVLEDVPFGLVPTLHLARLSGVPAPLHQSGVDILSACYGQDFSKSNDLLEEIGEMNMEMLLKKAVEGYAGNASH